MIQLFLTLKQNQIGPCVNCVCLPDDFWNDFQIVLIELFDAYKSDISFLTIWKIGKENSTEPGLEHETRDLWTSDWRAPPWQRLVDYFGGPPSG